ncbi:hypothetical protein niasHT_014519 [Heterodera trifolii]|uniref:Uncharacterized protein n=1 Tax=Heterodera trifolii TaxID=157864 RepID=A0ABD2L0L9_9BILA
MPLYASHDILRVPTTLYASHHILRVPTTLYASHHILRVPTTLYASHHILRVPTTLYATAKIPVDPGWHGIPISENFWGLGMPSLPWTQNVMGRVKSEPPRIVLAVRSINNQRRNGRR